MPRSRLLLVALASLAFAYAYIVEPTGDNQKAHYALVRALDRGSPSVDPSVAPGSRQGSVDVVRYRGHAYAAKAPGLAFASLPAYEALEAGGLRTGGEPRNALWALHLWATVIPAVVLLLLVVREADRVEPRFGLAAGVALGTATLVLPFSTVYFAHVLSAALGFAAYVVLRRARGLRGAGLAGLLAGLAVSVELPLGLVGVALAVLVLAGADRWRRLAAYAAGSIAGALPVFAYDQWAFGSPFHLSYENWHQPGSEPLPGVYGIATPSLHRLLELFFFPGGLAPLLGAVVGLVILYRRGLRTDALLVGGVALAYLLYNAGSYELFGGASPGPRYMIPALPFLALPLAAALRALPGLTIGLLVGGSAMMAAATITSPLAAWDRHVIHRLRTGGYVDTVLSFAGVHGAVAIVPFLAALALAAACAFRATPFRVTRADVVAGVLALGGWAVLATQSARLLVPGTHTRELLVLGLVAVLCCALAAVYRVRSLRPG